MIQGKIDHGAIEAAKHGLARSPHWPMAEHHFLKEHPKCAASGVTTGLQVHHVAAFHLAALVGRVDLELDMSRNGIVLSESEKGLDETNYHLLLGHAKDFQSSNLNVREDVQRMYGWSTEQIEADPVWQSRVRNRCKPWAQWTDQEKTEFRTYLDNLYPLPAKMTPERYLELLIQELKAKTLIHPMEVMP